MFFLFICAFCRTFFTCVPLELKHGLRYSYMQMRIAVYQNNLDDSYQILFYNAVRERADKLGIELLCIQEDLINWSEPMNRMLQSSNIISADGILLLTSSIISRRPYSLEEKIRKLFGMRPVVSAGMEICGIPSVVIDGEKSMHAVMDHLLNIHHCRSFLYVNGQENHPDNIMRKSVFINALDEADKNGIITDSDFTGTEFSVYGGMQAVSEYIRLHPDHVPDAVVCASDTIAAGVIRVLRDRNLPGWKNSAVTGFDDIDIAEMSGLTTVHQPISVMGRLSIDMLADLISNHCLTAPAVRIPSEPVFRNSCGCRQTSSVSHSATCLTDTVFQADSAQRTMSRFAQEINNAWSEKDIVSALQPFLNASGIAEFYLFLFARKSRTTPENAYIVYEKHGEKEQYSGRSEEVFLPDFFRSCIFKNRMHAEQLLFHYLSTGNEQFGIIVYSADSPAYPALCSCAVFLANALKRIDTIAEEGKRNELLETEVKKRTKKLERESRRRMKAENEVLEIGEQERKRFSMDLHDDICQRLAGISMMCRGTAAHSPEMTEISELIDETLCRTREYVHTSYPVDFDSITLKDAVIMLCRTMEKQCRGSVRMTAAWNIPDEALFTDRIAKINVYRIIQEAVHNAMKHAHASEVSVCAVQMKSSFQITIEDNGNGFTPQRSGLPGHGIGLNSMKYRADQIGGTFRIVSSETAGTRIIIRLPLKTGR
jgi:signal transduction histidine kinase/DNA-binding LacI/PurR family transcriptional regulator